MNLLEADAKAVLRRAGLALPSGAALVREGDAIANDRPVAVKAQILKGGRGKAGLIKLADAGEADAKAAEVFAALRGLGHDPLVLIEDQVDIGAEYYIAWRIDDVLQRPVLMFSPQGGIEVEENLEALRQFDVSPLRPVQPHELVPFLRDAGVPGRALGAVARFAAELHRVFRSEDAVLLEINPLVVTRQGRVVALDCKMTVDECAVSRHQDWHSTTSGKLRYADMTALEAEASRKGVTFVELEGDVAMVSSGAGLGMALVDLLGESGYRAANFCDLIGGSSQDVFSTMVNLVFDRAERDDVKAIVSFFTLSATPLRSAVMGIIETIKRRTPPKPMVVGFAASGSAEREMSSAQAAEAFGELGYRCVTDLAALVSALGEMKDPKSGQIERRA